MSDSNSSTDLRSVVRENLLPALVIFSIALIVRSIFLLQFSSFPIFDINFMDMDYFHRLATVGIPNTGFPDGPFFKAPLYPIFLKVIYALFGSGPWPVRIIQILLGSLSAALTYLIAIRLFSKRIAYIAGIIVCLSGTLVLYDCQLLVPTLTIFLNLIAMYMLIVAWQTQRHWLYWLAGVTFGLSAIARPTVLLVVVGIIIYLLWLKRCSIRKNWKAPCFILLGLLLAIAPITVRNAVQSHEFVLIGTYGGINLYIGNNLQSDGVSATVPGTGLDWWHDGIMDDTRRIADKETGKTLSVAEQSTYWRNRALGEISDNPKFFIKHVGFKFLLFLGGYELANNFDIRYVSERIPLLNYLILRKPIYWPWGILLPLSLAGMILIRRWRPEQKFLLVFLAGLVPAFLLFFVTARYRLPLIPFLAIFSAFAIDAMLTKFERVSARRITFATIVFFLFLIIGRLDPKGYASGSDAQGHQMMGALYEGKGDIEAAEHYYRSALRSDSTLPHSHNDLGLLLLNRGEIDNAITHLELAVKYRPDEWLIQYNLGRAYKTAERWSDAITQYDLVLTMAPEMETAASDLALTWLRAGYPDTAIVHYKQLLDSHPEDFVHTFSLGLSYHILGQRDSALSYYGKTISLNPDYPETYFNLGLYWDEARQPDSVKLYFERFLRLSTAMPQQEKLAQRKIDSLNQQ